MTYKISIIIPVYKAQNYIEQCATSLFNQDFDSIEYIFIDDFSPDDSMLVLKKVIDRYPHRGKDIKLLSNLENKGSGYTRKKGVISSTGEYTIQIDADDWIENTMCSSLYQKAIESDADIVICDYFTNKLNKEMYIKQKASENAELDFRAVLLGGLHGSLCNKLIKRKLFTDNNIYPPQKFSLYEDKFTILQLLHKAKKTAYLPRAFLHYRQHTSSMSAHVISDKMVNDTILFVQALEEFFEKEDLFKKFNNDFKSCVLYHKKNFIIDEKYYKYWYLVHPEVNKIRYIKNIQVYNWKKKLITLLAMLISKRVLGVSYKIYKS